MSKAPDGTKTQPVATRRNVGGSESDQILRLLRSQQVSVAGDVIEVAERTWAIHGAIAVDGEVIIAAFGSASEARAVLAQLPVTERLDVTLARRHQAGASSHSDSGEMLAGRRAVWGQWC